MEEASSFEILEALPFVGIVVAKDRKIAYATRAVEKILGWSAAELAGRPLSEIFSETAFEIFAGSLAQIEAGEFAALKVLIPCRHKNGADVHCVLSLAPLPGRPVVVISLQDAEANGSGRDSLTGLHTRKTFFILAEHGFAMARRFNRRLCLIFADLDGLKMVNDRFGHSAGDEMILAAANALKRALRASDIICRFGGDEFVALGLSEACGEEAIVQRVRESLKLDGRGFAAKYGQEISLSIGAVRCDMKRPLQDCLDQADTLMYEEKRRKKAERK